MKDNYWTNLKIAHILRSVAAAYTLEGKDYRFQIIAYQRAADAIEHSTSELFDLWEDNKLTEVPGIGPSIASHLDELFRKGHSAHFDELLGHYPESVFELMNIPGVGAKSAFKLAKALGISKSHGAVEKLAEASRKGNIQKVEGFGADSEAKILKSISDLKNRSYRLLLPMATSLSDDVVAWLHSSTMVERVEPLGSLRRQCATVGDIDIAVATKYPLKVLAYFCKYPKATRIIESGKSSASIIVNNSTQIDLYVQTPDSFGSLLQHLTGSKFHNIALRTYANKLGFSLSEYGISDLEKGTGALGGGKIRKFADEETFYNYLKLDWIPPELREDTGEIESARQHELPNLVKIEDVKGDLQIHSNFPIEPSHDLGIDTPEDILKFADSLKYEYIAFTEHNPSVNNHTPAQSIELIKRKKLLIEKLNDSREKSPDYRVIKIFNSLEIDIRPDGTLSIPEKAFDYLDFALVSIHSSFSLPKLEMTKRVLNALSHPKVKIFAHPTGRLLNQRPEVELDWDIIFDFCLKNNKWIEINADPYRLDLPDLLVREAIKKGVRLTLGTDSHNKNMMANMKYGISVARRGWAEPKNIINTLTLNDLLPLLP